MLNNPFRSFWMAGFECTDKLNCFGNRVDFLKVTGHLENIEEDYQNLGLFDISTVREGIRWSVVERTPYQYDWSDVKRMIDCAIENDIQIVWDICHFGFPDDLTPLHPMFARRFARLCSAFVKFYRSLGLTDQLIVTPINEVSFLSWLGGDACGTVPYCRAYGWEVKYALAKAYIEGVEAIREADDNVVIMATEPLANMVPHIDATELEVIHAARVNEDQFQVMDILTGKICPELRGNPSHIDIIGVNYYHDNQWIVGTHEFLPWANENNDPRFQTLSALMNALYARYQKPLVLTETSHPGEHKPNWIESITTQCRLALNMGVPLLGICWYPIIDRPDWDFMHPWHKAGIWDIETTVDGRLVRVLDTASANALLQAQNSLASYSSEKV